MLKNNSHKSSLKTLVLMDISNIRGCEGRISYEKLLGRIKNLYPKVVRAVAFSCYDPLNGNKNGFFGALHAVGIHVYKKPVKTMINGVKKGNLDVEFTIEAIKSIPFVNTYVLCTGDGDFEALVKYLKEKGKRVVVVAPNRECIAKDLARIADEVYYIRELGVQDEQGM